MNRRGQEIEMEHLIAAGLAIIAGLTSLFVMHAVHVPTIFKVGAFIVSTLAGFFIAYFVLSSG